MSNLPLQSERLACADDFRTGDSPPPGAAFAAVRIAAALALRGYLATYHRFQISGRENLPTGGSFILVSNHSSHLDAACLMSALPLHRIRRARTMAAEDYFFHNVLRIAFSTILTNATPFSRHLHLRKSLELYRRLLQQPGNTLIMFPEGTRSTTGNLNKFCSGIGILVAGSEIPVIPCALHGADSAWPKGTRLPRPRPIRLVVGKKRVYTNLSRTRQSADLVALDLRTAVEELLCR